MFDKHLSNVSSLGKKNNLVLRNFCYFLSLYILILSSSFFSSHFLLLYFSSLPELLCLFFSCLSFYHPFPFPTLLIPFFIPSFHSLLILSVLLFTFFPSLSLALPAALFSPPHYFLTPPLAFNFSHLQTLSQTKNPLIFFLLLFYSYLLSFSPSTNQFASSLFDIPTLLQCSSFCIVIVMVDLIFFYYLLLDVLFCICEQI